MSDYISRETVAHNVQMALHTNGEVMNAIYDTPAADVAPVKHGRWYAIGNTGLATCKCGFFTDRHLTYRYCPACGTRMDGDADELRGS